MRASNLNSFISIRVSSVPTWLAGALILLSIPNAFADSDFSTFWQKFKPAVIAGDKAAVGEMTKFPLSMPYDMENAPSRFMFELTKGGWRFVGLDNINE
jgi:hypothetical protein